MKDFKPMVKMQTGGSVMGRAVNTGPLGAAKPGGPVQSMDPSLEKAQTYKAGGKRRK